ncbi:MAG: DUF2442 domain-containing protein [Bacteroidetes bacterium]|nr:DUF2442 domain-containing protein [Bacteroidota bacterium]MBS1940202.1 DUF2442 domain-containing protein [Bacteroidota bacterium]MBS1945558.1 DUF2442 domain-containing protein [Bacteroidota bacterium]
MSNRKPVIQDPVSAMIRDQGVRITAVHAIKEANLLLVMLNEGRLEFPLDGFKRLAKASQTQLNKYELLPDGAGVHWPGLDEHLSLRGFLLATMRNLLHRPTSDSAGARMKAIA